MFQKISSETFDCFRERSILSEENVSEENVSEENVSEELLIFQKNRIPTTPMYWTLRRCNKHVSEETLMFQKKP
jgi:hypothetical protein